MSTLLTHINTQSPVLFGELDETTTIRRNGGAVPITAVALIGVLADAAAILTAAYGLGYAAGRAVANYVLSSCGTFDPVG